MKEKELRQRTRCVNCDLLIGETRVPLFYVLRIERHAIDLNAVQRKAGLGSFLGSPMLATVMGPDEEMTRPIMEPMTVTICERCAIQPVILAAIVEQGQEQRNKKESDGNEEIKSHA